MAKQRVRVREVVQACRLALGPLVLVFVGLSAVQVELPVERRPAAATVLDEPSGSEPFERSNSSLTFEPNLPVSCIRACTGDDGVSANLEASSRRQPRVIQVAVNPPACFHRKSTLRRSHWHATHRTNPRRRS
jgi:hypothetical protein